MEREEGWGTGKKDEGGRREAVWAPVCYRGSGFSLTGRHNRVHPHGIADTLEGVLAAVFERHPR